jgi:hypothetical protein
MTGFKSKKAAALDEEGMYLVHQTKAKLGAAPDNFHAFKQPERSEWHCYLFGNTPQDNQGIVWIPIKGQEPNWFVRWMMQVCFACTWVKEKNND